MGPQAKQSHTLLRRAALEACGQVPASWLTQRFGAWEMESQTPADLLSILRRWKRKGEKTSEGLAWKELQAPTCPQPPVMEATTGSESSNLLLGWVSASVSGWLGALCLADMRVGGVSEDEFGRKGSKRAVAAAAEQPSFLPLPGRPLMQMHFNCHQGNRMATNLQHLNFIFSLKPMK